MNLQNFAELERLLQNGLPGCLASLFIENNSSLMFSDHLAEFIFVFFARAMVGSVPFEEALAARLSLFKPSLSQIQDFLEKRPPRYDLLLSWLYAVFVSLFRYLCTSNIFKTERTWY